MLGVSQYPNSFPVLGYWGLPEHIHPLLPPRAKRCWGSKNYPGYSRAMEPTGRGCGGIKLRERGAAEPPGSPWWDTAACLSAPPRAWGRWSGWRAGLGQAGSSPELTLPGACEPLGLARSAASLCKWVSSLDGVCGSAMVASVSWTCGSLWGQGVAGDTAGLAALSKGNCDSTAGNVLVVGCV